MNKYWNNRHRHMRICKVNKNRTLIKRLLFVVQWLMNANRAIRQNGNSTRFWGLSILPEILPKWKTTVFSLKSLTDMIFSMTTPGTLFSSIVTFEKLIISRGMLMGSTRWMKIEQLCWRSIQRKTCHSKEEHHYLPPTRWEAIRNKIMQTNPYCSKWFHPWCC